MRAACSILLLLLTACGVDPDGPLQLRLGHVANPGSMTADTATEFARLANQKLAGRAFINVFGSSQLGDDQTLLLKLKLGTVDFSIPSTIMKIAKALEPYNLMWLEEPVPAEVPESYARIRASTTTPICGGENWYLTYGFRHPLEIGAVDVIMGLPPTN